MAADIHPESADGWTAASQNRPALATVPGAGSEMSWKASDSGYKAWTFNPEIMPATTAATTPSSGVMNLMGVKFPGGLATNFSWFQKAAGATAANVFGGLLNSAGALVAVTADLATAANTGANQPKTAAFVTPVVLPAGRFYLVMLHGTAGSATLGGAADGNPNVGLASGSYRAFTQGSSLTAIATTNTLTGTPVNTLPFLAVS